MDELDISGKRFISSKRAAKDNKYHVDYIGQLIRGGKIIGSKVGRTWYVEAESLAAYLGKEYKAPQGSVVADTFVARTPARESAVETENPIVEEPVQKVEKEFEIKMHHVPEYQAARAENIFQEQSHAIEIKKGIIKEESPVPFSALTYLSDDEPLAPMRTTTHVAIEKPIAITALQKPIARARVAPAPKVKSASRRSRVLIGAALAVVGIGVFAAALGASYMLSYTNTIEGTQNTASLGLSR